jgi:O-Antigen ligase
MSRFRPRISASGVVLTAPQSAPTVQAPPPPRFDRPAPVSPAAVESVETRGNVMQRIGFWVLCGYLVSGALNEWMLRLFGVKGYLSVLTLVSLPVVWLSCGTGFRGLQHSIGKWWAAFLVLVLAATPLSIWRGGSVELLFNYIPRSYMLFFYVAALTLSFRNCRQLMYVNVCTTFVTLVTCIAFGTHGDDGRYRVPGGVGFLDNSNELAMALLMGMTQFMYLFWQNNRLGKALAILGIVLSMPFMLWTGSRGGVIGAVAYIMVLLYTSRQRVRDLVIVMVLAAIGVAFAPSSVLHRLTLMTGDEPTSSTSDLSAIQSQMSRIALLKRSVSETVSHPLFGVGPGQFPVQVMDEAKAKNEWFQYLGTHNSYTQVSSECGIPAFICYLMALVLSIRTSFKIWRDFHDQPKHTDIASLGLALFSGSVVYAVCSFFFHMAYTGTLPLIAGQTTALYLVVRQRLRPLDERVA